MKAAKVEIDGMVAVLISPEYGAGWSTWTYGGQEETEELVFCPELVNMVLGNATLTEMEEFAEQRWPDQYTGGLRGLQVKWVPKGEQFAVAEYDGHETLLLLGKPNTYIA